MELFPLLTWENTVCQKQGHDYIQYQRRQVWAVYMFVLFIWTSDSLDILELMRFYFNFEKWKDIKKQNVQQIVPFNSSATD